MGIMILLIFQILLVSTSVYAEMSKVDMMKMVCNEDNSQIKNSVAKCIDEMDLEPYKDIMEKCNPEMGNDYSGAAMMKYSCERSEEEWEKADKCAVEMIKERGDDEGVEKKMMDDMTKCVEKKMDEERKRK